MFEFLSKELIHLSQSTERNGLTQSYAWVVVNYIYMTINKFANRDGKIGN